MASTRGAVVPVVQPKERAGEAKRNGAKAERKNRPVLRDIGNVVIAPAVGEVGKPQTQISRPMTRNFLAQQVANAQAAAAAAKNSKKPLADVANAVVALKAVSEVVVQKKEDEK